MDMWNWLIDCYKDGCLTLEELEEIMTDDKAAENLWEEWSRDSSEFVKFVRDEVRPFILYLKQKKKNDN